MKIVPVCRNNISLRSFYNAKGETNPSTFAQLEYKQPSAQAVPIVVREKKSVNKNLLLGIGVVSAIAIGIAFGNKNKIKSFLEVKDLKKIAEDLNDLFPQDTKYRNKIASAIGINAQDSYKLSSIVGAEELTYVAKEFEQNPEVYSPGMVRYTIFDAVENFDNSNVRDGIFGANFHLHTENSDGKFSVKELLDKCVEYADKRFKTQKEPFYLAITDHDTVNGCKEAVEIVSRNPQKFKNLRLILGLENTFVYKNPDLLTGDAQVHVLSYGINPYSKQFDGLIGDKLQKNIDNIKRVISGVNEEFRPLLSKNNVQYKFEDMPKLSKAIAVGIKNSTFYMKDYFQFKYIFNKTVLNNKELCSELKNTGMNFADIDFSKPISMIGGNLDYSKGQKYYDYYYKAAQDYITSLVEPSKKSKISSFFKELTSEDRDFLQKIESRTLDEHSSLYVKPNDFFSIEEGIAKLSQMDDGVISMAHPGVFFPMTALKDRSKLPDMYEDLYRIFTQEGGEKAIFAEDNYQSYYRTNKDEIYSKLKDISSKYGLIKTGGLDTHSKDIFSL